LDCHASGAIAVTATALPAQTTSSTTQRTTPPVTAESDKDLTDPNAMKLSLQDAIRTSMERNLGISLQSYDYRMAGESLRSQYSLYDWFAQSTIQQTSVKGAVQTLFATHPPMEKRIERLQQMEAQLQRTPVAA